MAIDLTTLALDDPIEAAYLAERRRGRRRVLLILLTTVLVVSSAVGWKVLRHLVAASWLQANHHQVIWETDAKNWRSGGGTSVRYVERWSIAHNSTKDADLRFLTWLHRVEELDLATATGLVDDDLRDLGKLRSLRILNLDQSRPSYWGNQRLTRLTDETLAQIEWLTNLEDLNLGAQGITDAGLVHLARLPRLKDIDLRYTRITDAGLEHLKALPCLKSLDLIGTRVTQEGIAKFQAERPDVKIVDDSEITAIPTITPPKR